jgi:hypothetical protein
MNAARCAVWNLILEKSLQIFPKVREKYYIYAIFACKALDRQL